jgi:hypothetical protein
MSRAQRDAQRIARAYVKRGKDAAERLYQAAVRIRGLVRWEASVLAANALKVAGARP